MSRTVIASKRLPHKTTNEIIAVRARWYAILTILLFLIALFSLTGIGVFAWQCYQEYLQRIAQLEDELHVQKRSQLRVLQNHLVDKKNDPREAKRFAAEVLQFAEPHRLPTHHVQQVAAQLPQPQVLPDGSSIRLHEVAFKSPALMAEISISDSSGDFVPNLTRVDFELFNGTERLKQAQVGHDTRIAQEQGILILCDCSKSMAGERLNWAKQAVTGLVSEIEQPHRVQIRKFSDRSIILTPWTFDKEVLSTAIGSLVPDNGTALYAAMQEAISALQQRTGHRTLIVLTDGEDSFKQISPQLVIRESQQAHVQIHVVALSSATISTDVLRSFAQETGGRFYATNHQQELLSAFRQISESFREPIYRIAILDSIDPQKPLTLRMDRLPEVTLQVARP